MVNALVAADEVLVPYLPTPLSTAALPIPLQHDGSPLSLEP